MNIVFVSHSSFNENLVVGSHHLSRAMAASGHTVWHVGPPVTPFHFLRPSNKQYRERLSRSKVAPSNRDRVTSLEPFALVPWQIARRFLSWGNLFVLSSNLVGKLRKVFAPGQIDLLLVDDPRFAYAEKLLKPKAFFYRPTDLYAEMKGDQTLIAAERHLLARCAGVISTSQPVMHHALTLRPGLPSLLLENGVDYQHFVTPVAEPEELRSIPHPRVVYVGAIDFRFDHGMLALLAERLPNVHFVLIGPGGNRAKMGERPNIHVLGAKPYDEVPGFLQFSEVGILPLVDNLTNSGRSPMKLYEYGAAGLPVLATRTKELERRRDKFVHLFSTIDEAVERLEKLVKAAPDRRQIAEGCRIQAWTNKASTLLEFVSHCREEAPSAGIPVLEGLGK